MLGRSQWEETGWDPGTQGAVLWEPRRETEGYRQISPKSQHTLVTRGEVDPGAAERFVEKSVPCHRWLGSDIRVTIE